MTEGHITTISVLGFIFLWVQFNRWLQGAGCECGPRPAVRRVYGRNGRHPPWQFSLHASSMCHTLGEWCRDSPTATSFSSNPCLNSPHFLGEFDISNILTFSPPWTVDKVLSVFSGTRGCCSYKPFYFNVYL